MESDPDTTDKLRSLEIDDIHTLFDDDEDRFPVTTEEIIEEFGDLEVAYPGGGAEPLESVLGTSGMETYGTVDDLQLAVLNGVQRDAVGRPRYSDRALDQQSDNQSF